MKKKIILGIIICISIVAIIAGVVWGVRIYQREKDPYWQLAKKIYNTQTALQEENENWELESLSDVRPFEIIISDDTSINYYCCITSYLNEEPNEINGLNKVALGQVIDVDALENPRNCEVNSMAAIMGEFDGKAYLCWTLSPKYSCVIECPIGAVAEEDVFRMAESVGEPEK